MDLEDLDCEIDHLALDHLCGDLMEELINDKSNRFLLLFYIIRKPRKEIK